MDSSTVRPGPWGRPDPHPLLLEVIAWGVRTRRALADAASESLAAVADLLRLSGHALVRATGRARGWVVDTARTGPLPVRPAVSASLAVVTGCWLAAALSGTAFVWGAVAAAALVCWGVASWSGRGALAATALVIAVVAAMASWTTARLDLFPADDLAWSLTDDARPVAVEATVVEASRPGPGGDPRRNAGSVPGAAAIVTVTAVRSGDTWRPASGRARVVVGGAAPDLVAGAVVRIHGRALRPPPSLNPGEFDQRRRARLTRTLSLIRVRPEGIVLLSAPAPWRPLAVLSRLRDHGARALAAHLPPPRAALAAALLLGERDALDPAIADDFLVTGTVHILSISGLHVGILAMFAAALFRAIGLPRGVGLALVALSTGAYAAMVGGDTPVVRAMLVVWLTCAGAACGRPGGGINALAVAALVVALATPGETLAVGTQLSFLSTAALLAVVGRPPRSVPDPVERLLDASASPGWRWLRRRLADARTALVAGTAVWLVTAPLVAARFHLVSPVALVLNPLISPLVALAMGWGFLCVITAPLASAVAAPCGALCNASLAAVEWAVRLAARLPGGHAWVAAPPEWWVIGAYGGALALLLWLPAARLRSVGTWALAASAWCAVGLVAAGAAGRGHVGPARVEVVVAAMGHGCGIVVRGPTGRCLVFDAGRLGAPVAAERGLAAVLWDRGVTRIDTLVISHADTDHFNAVPGILERFKVAAVAVPAAFAASDAPAVRSLRDRLAAAAVPLQVLAAGDDLPFEPLCRVRVLHPAAGADESPADDNQSSLVLAVEAAGRRLLLTGDLDGEALERFVDLAPGACDAVVAPHHGSLAAAGTGIVAATAPRWVLVSGAGGDRWPDVRAAYTDAAGPGTAVLRSGGEGAILLEFAATEIVVRQHRGGRWRQIAAPAEVPVVRPGPSPGAAFRAAGAAPPPRGEARWLRGT